ncbi:MAG: hypothetical protein HY739_12000 [Desulfobacterales bacterium]|nr:hypothetical protein [Desulfobacterales bacterium]
MGFITTVSNPLSGRVKLNIWDVSKEIIQAKNAREAVSPGYQLRSESFGEVPLFASAYIF